MEKIYLKDNWAETFVYGDKTPGFFVGRRDELESLKFALLHNNSGTILISAIRGVGKTSFVHKALSEIEIKVHPIFVNAGYVINSLKDNDPSTCPRKELLVSLIRSAYFEFKDKDIERLYHIAIGKFREYKKSEQSREQTSEKKVDLSLNYNLRHVVILVGSVLAAIGIITQSWWMNVLGVLGIISIPISFIWKKKWTQGLSEKFGREIIVENNMDYLEILFEVWLKKQKDKKLVFVIDELDKVSDEKAFKLIKEYKNLFSRSFAHFIFIAGPDAYQLTKGDRELDVDKGGIFPTLFTYSYYLPLPTTNDLKEYLSKIFIASDDVPVKRIENLKNYLLFYAKNDFFALKKLINDLLLIEGKRAFLDMDIIKENDIFFYNRAVIYNYASMFCDKYRSRAKKYWEGNSIFQQNVFSFLNQHLKRNFKLFVDDELAYIRVLLMYLQRLAVIEIVETKDVTITENENEITKKETKFRWTGKYKSIERADQLFDEEKKFIDSFKRMVKIANNIDDLIEHYIDDQFETHSKIYKGRDGENLSGVSLYSVYSNFVELYNSVNNPKKRMEVLIEDVDKAKEEIQSKIEEVRDHAFQVLTNATQEILSSVNDLFLGQTFKQKPDSFNACPNFNSVFSRYSHGLYGKNDGSRELALIKDFEAFDEIQDGLKSLGEQNNLLAINLITNNKNLPRNPLIKVGYKDKIGRNRKKNLKIKNFINFVFTGDFRKLSEMLKMIQEHLGS